jgi:hypothetical protein
MNARQTNMQSGSRHEITIREFYNDFIPPGYVLRLVTRLISTVPAEHTVGFDCVILTNQSGAPRRDRLGKVTSRSRRLPQRGVLGRYHHTRSNRAAWIELYVDNIITGIAAHPWVPVGRTACFASVLFHEIGHHVHATVRPEFRQKEDVADDWSGKLMANYFFTRYWYVPKPLWRIVAWGMRAIAAEP